MNADIFVYDFETTDNDPKTCGVVQVSVVGRTDAGYRVLIDKVMLPEVAISKEASDVHGWTKEKLEARNASPENIAMPVVFSTMGTEGVQVICGYNNERFDDTILKRYYECIYEQPPFEARFKSFDLMKFITRHHLLDSYKLGDVYNHFFDDYDSEKAHESTYDCIMVLKLIDLLVEDVLAEVENLKIPQVIPIMPFGKHAGKPFYKMPRRYMRYMLSLDINADVRKSMEDELVKRPGR